MPSIGVASMQKYCPKCFTKYPMDLERCPADNRKLVAPGERNLVGEEIDERYRIRRILGKGGMGIVYVAEQIMIGREVALKVLRREMVQDESSVKRFLTEAKAIASLKNPHTITLYDFGVTDDGLLYYTMEMLEGRPLSTLLTSRGPMHHDEAAEIILQTLESLKEAHDRDILHRDLKPDNVFISEVGGRRHATVLDFGIAKLVGDQSMETITKTGMICGTPQYLAPEQVLGNTATPASDLYSLGIMLYEMLAGLPPFQETTPMKILLKHLNEKPVPVRVRNPDVEVPAAVDDFLQKTLEKEPTKRYRTCMEFGEALKAALVQHTASPQTVTLSSLTSTSDGVSAITDSYGDPVSREEPVVSGMDAPPQPRETTRETDESLVQTIATPRPGTGAPALESARSGNGLWFGLGGAVVALVIALAFWQPWTGSVAPGSEKRKGKSVEEKVETRKLVAPAVSGEGKGESDKGGPRSLGEAGSREHDLEEAKQKAAIEKARAEEKVKIKAEARAEGRAEAEAEAREEAEAKAKEEVEARARAEEVRKVAGAKAQAEAEAKARAEAEAKAQAEAEAKAQAEAARKAAEAKAKARARSKAQAKARAEKKAEKEVPKEKEGFGMDFKKPVLGDEPDKGGKKKDDGGGMDFQKVNIPE
jgi:serine/threonine protein kinase